VSNNCLPISFREEDAYRSTATSSAADFVLATLPWYILWNLQMKRKEKILTALSMSLGLL
jgi:hypothetical protein